MTTNAKVIPGRPAVTQVVQPATPEMVELSMERKTAEVLRLILCKVGGSPSGLRGEADKMAAALRDAGVSVYGQRIGEYMHEATNRAADGCLYLKV
jgi:hypothetical protein